jgi:uncharacterized protein YtpQ (UPF0354 family)
MFPTPLKKFDHPNDVYHLDYPAHWDQVTQKDGEACGFGPHERDDVALWISVMPLSVDSDQLVDALPAMMNETVAKNEAVNPRPDPSLQHLAWVADRTKKGEAGHLWLVTAGDVLLLATSQVPAAEADHWNPLFQQVMSSLRVTRDDELLVRRATVDLLTKLRDRHPEQGFEFEDNKIRGKEQVIYLGNFYREVCASPDRSSEIIERFVETIGRPNVAGGIGAEPWENVRDCILPVLKPRAYINGDGPTKQILHSEWLADIVICYVINSKTMIRFVTGHDLERWQTTHPELHDLAVENLGKLPWPKQLMGTRGKSGGRLIIVDTDDSIASSRLLHPDLYELFSGPLGSPFLAGIPCRNRLVLYSDEPGMKNRIAKQLRRDHDESAYSISPRVFLVTRDGIALSNRK